jgi:hypothetical protein
MPRKGKDLSEGNMKPVMKKTSAAPALRKRGSPTPSLDLQEVRIRVARKAYELFERRGRVHGDDLKDWYEAERMILDRAESEERKGS